MFSVSWLELTTPTPDRTTLNTDLVSRVFSTLSLVLSRKKFGNQISISAGPMVFLLGWSSRLMNSSLASLQLRITVNSAL